MPLDAARCRPMPPGGGRGNPLSFGEAHGRLSRADEALYAAKDSGRNAVVVLADPPPG